MSERHTPGPWAIREDCVGFDQQIVRWLIHDRNASGRGYKPIATVHAGFTRAAADARLIAAAPDLLAACEAATALLDEWGETIAGAGAEVYDQLRAALARAKGEQP